MVTRERDSEETESRDVAAHDGMIKIHVCGEIDRPARARRGAREKTPFHARLISADGTRCGNEKQRKYRERQRALRRPAQKIGAAQNSHDCRGDMWPTLPVTHLAGRKIAQILKSQCAQDQCERNASRNDRDMLCLHFAKIRLSSSKALNSSALPLGSVMKNVACSPGLPSKRISGAIRN